MWRVNFRMPDEIKTLLKGERERTKQSFRQLVQQAITQVYEERPEAIRFRAPRYPAYVPLSDFVGESASFAIVGATLRTLREVPETREFLLSKARAHASMTFILVARDGPAHILDTLAETLSITVQGAINEINKTVDFLREVRAEAGDFAPRVVIKGLPVFPTLGITIVEPSTPETRIRVTFYPMQSQPRYDPFLEIDGSFPEGREAVTLFQGHYEHLLMHSQDIT